MLAVLVLLVARVGDKPIVVVTDTEPSPETAALVSARTDAGLLEGLDRLGLELLENERVRAIVSSTILNPPKLVLARFICRASQGTQPMTMEMGKLPKDVAKALRAELEARGISPKASARPDFRVGLAFSAAAALSSGNRRTTVPLSGEEFPRDAFNVGSFQEAFVPPQPGKNIIYDKRYVILPPSGSATVRAASLKDATTQIEQSIRSRWRLFESEYALWAEKALHGLVPELKDAKLYGPRELQELPTSIQQTIKTYLSQFGPSRGTSRSEGEASRLPEATKVESLGVVIRANVQFKEGRPNGFSWPLVGTRDVLP